MTRQWRHDHRHALAVIVAAVLSLLILGWAHAAAAHWPLWHGEYCSLANGVTDGCDTGPPNGWTYLVSAVEYLTVVPLFAAAVSLFTSASTTEHVRRHVASAAEGVKLHTDARLRHHLGTSAGDGTQAEGESPK